MGARSLVEAALERRIEEDRRRMAAGEVGKPRCEVCGDVVVPGREWRSQDGQTVLYETEKRCLDHLAVEQWHRRPPDLAVVPDAEPELEMPAISFEGRAPCSFCGGKISKGRPPLHGVRPCCVECLAVPEIRAHVRYLRVEAYFFARRARAARIRAAVLEVHVPKEPAPARKPSPTPAPPPVRTCSFEGCATKLRVNNLSGRCPIHKLKLTKKPGRPGSRGDPLEPVRRFIEARVGKVEEQAREASERATELSAWAVELRTAAQKMRDLLKT